MIIRKLRLQRGWSQEQLAELTGLSVRTIQRIERGQNPGLESANALAAVFEIDRNVITKETAMPISNELTSEEEQAIRQVRDIKGFYANLICYLIVMPILIAVDVILSPDDLWFYGPALGWGLGVIFHGLGVFEVFPLFSPAWEKRQIEKRLGRKLQ